ncbi:MAG: T9SS type A sorting domain-containing protein [Bacteroidales bacterium]|nr:T9SS type A sorting domain-containing protein [Bacteroidales bacterium]
MKSLLLIIALAMGMLTVQADQFLDYKGTMESSLYPVGYAGEPLCSSLDYQNYVCNVLDMNLEAVATFSVGDMESYFVRVCGVETNTPYDESAYVTQHLFNDDDFFEYISNEGNHNYKIMQSNGNCLASFSAPHYGEFDFLLMGKKLYLIVDGNDENTIYEVNRDKTTDALRVVRTEARDSSKDLVITKGENLMIGKVDGASARLTIMATNGTVIRQIDSVGSEFSVPTGDMASGLYIYQINSNGQKLSCGRLIVK